MNVCLCGGGSQTHIIGACLSQKKHAVTILTRHPDDWDKDYIVYSPKGEIRAGIAGISDNPQDVIPEADIILLTVPGTVNESELVKIKPYIKPGAYVGGIFCSSGFFIEAMKVLPDDVILWGLQRVPFIARVNEYGKSANLLGYKSLLKVAVERTSPDKKEEFRAWIENNFETKTELLKNYLEATVTNSNPLLHTSRLYTMFRDWSDEMREDHNIPFYEESTEEAAALLIRMDEDLFRLLSVLPVTPGFLSPLLEYYESKDAKSLAAKISSITAFKGILSPMKKVDGGWVPDYASRYFTEDFGHSLRIIYDLARSHGVNTPYIDKVYEWGRGKLEN